MIEHIDLKRTSSHYVRVLLSQAERLGLDPRAIASNLDIPENAIKSSDQRVENEIVPRLMRYMIQQVRDESLGFLPHRIRLGTLAVLCDYMIDARTLGEFLRRGERLGAFLMPDNKVTLEVSGKNALLFTPVLAREVDADHFMSELWTLVWHRIPCWAIDERIELCVAKFPYPAPDHAELYKQLFQSEIQFDSEIAVLEFNHSYLNRPIVRTRQELDAFIGAFPQDMFVLPGKRTSTRARLTSTLKELLLKRQQFPSFETICLSLGISPAAARSKLKDEGTSYQKLKDRVRRDFAIELLESSDLSISDIAIRVGFAEPAALTRAFKKWMGVSPMQFRKHV